MTRTWTLLMLTCLTLASVAFAQDEARLIGAPDMPPTRIAADGTIAEAWGTMKLSLAVGGETARVTSTDYTCDPFPVARTSLAGGGIRMDIDAFRAPIWPDGFDVVTAHLSNATGAPVATTVTATLPTEMGLGDTGGNMGGSYVLRLPDGLTPERKAREWGCATPASRLPGWARPNRACDPAFANIRAGMGGIPIIYRLKVAPGSSHQVAIGLCESHWAISGQRPFVLYVEGGEKRTVDCVAEFGQHVPACLVFDGRDANNDGLLQVVSAPGPGAPDRNPILNVIWVFPTGEYLDPGEVIAGRMNAAAEYYVDVGGPTDQDLYEGGELRFPITVPAAGAADLTFLLAPSPGHVPSPSEPLPSLVALRDAAADVWNGWLSGLDRDLARAPGVRPALARIAMSQAQSDDFHLAVPEFGQAAGYSLATHAAVVAALDEAGVHSTAERLLRILWDAGAPDPFKPFARIESGGWGGAADDGNAQAMALYALAHHAVVTDDAGFAELAWPAVDGAAKVLGAADSAWAKAALAEATKVAAMVGAETPDWAINEAAELAAAVKQLPTPSETMAAAKQVLLAAR